VAREAAGRLILAPRGQNVSGSGLRQGARSPRRGRSGLSIYSLKPNLSLDFTKMVPAGFGDRFENELTVAPNGRLDLSFSDRS
jgi:hypothetical protein